MQGFSACNVMLASAKLLYRHDVSADIAALVFAVMAEEADATRTTSALNLKMMVLQRLRDGGGARAQAAARASNNMLPTTLDAGPMTVTIPVSSHSDGVPCLGP